MIFGRKEYSDEDLERFIIDFAFENYKDNKKKGGSDCLKLNRELSEWYRINKNEDRLNEIYNKVDEILKEVDVEVYNHMNSHFRFGNIRFYRD